MVEPEQAGILARQLEEVRALTAPPATAHAPAPSPRPCPSTKPEPCRCSFATLQLAAAVQGSGNGNGSNRAAGVLHCKPRHRQLSHQQQGRHQQAHALAGGDEHGPRRCSGCGSDTTSAWRRHPDSGARLCQACREFMRRHNGRLPLSGVQCLQCGGASAGPSKGAYWREHPLTGQRWICTPCECGAGGPGAQRPRFMANSVSRSWQIIERTKRLCLACRLAKL